MSRTTEMSNFRLWATGAPRNVTLNGLNSAVYYAYSDTHNCPFPIEDHGCPSFLTVDLSTNPPTIEGCPVHDTTYIESPTTEETTHRLAALTILAGRQIERERMRTLMSGGTYVRPQG